MKRDLFTDAQEMARKYPETFEAPTQQELSTLFIGDLVKVCAMKMERFWVRLSTVDGNNLTGVVDNDLIFTDDHGLKLGDVIEFEKRHVYNIWVDEKKEVPQ